MAKLDAVVAPLLELSCLTEEGAISHFMLIDLEFTFKLISDRAGLLLYSHSIELLSL